MERIWKIQPILNQEIRSANPELSPLMLQLLVNRGRTTPELVEQFLHAEDQRYLHRPQSFRMMDKAVERVIVALKNQEVLALYGDYDVDGVSSLAVIAETLTALGHQRFLVYIPDRSREGYGVHQEAVASLVQQGATLLITCDCGTSNVEEITEANRRGLDVIVVDHHEEPPTLPPAYALLNPKITGETYPWRELAATGIAWKFMVALLERLRTKEKELLHNWEEQLLDLVALATIADLAPLLGENRTLVKRGLKVLQHSVRPGLRALAEVIGTPLSAITTTSVGYQLAPRLNAAGRLRHARMAYELLTAKDDSTARRLSSELHATNAERQKITQKTYEEALSQIPTDALPRLLVTYGEQWTSGVIGLVASKLKETFHRPCLAIGREGDRLVGSGRSVHGFHITEALVQSQDHLSHFGGHAMACGFTLRSADMLTPFTTAMQTLAQSALTDDQLLPVVTIDAVVPFRELDEEMLSLLGQLEPFGMSVPRPTFATMKLAIADMDRVGVNGRHVRLRLTDGRGMARRAIGFGLGDHRLAFQSGQTVDCAYHVLLNEWKGRRTIELELVDVRPSP